MKDKIVFSVADDANLPHARLLEKSLEFFHPDVEFKLYGSKDLEGLTDIKRFFYLATPFFAKELIKKYSLVIKIDADTVITGPLDDVFNCQDDLGVVLNNNRREPLVTVHDVPPKRYFNCGFVAMRSREMINHWWNVCTKPFFDNYRFGEQDILNIIINYGNYNVSCLESGDKWYGLISKSEWERFIIQNGKLVCPSDVNYNPTQRTVCAIHAAGGNVEKWNWPKQFQPEVVKYLQEITE